MKNKPIIKYTDRSFEEIKNSLVEHAKRFYPDRYNDFNEASFGSMVFDSVAYVGDLLSFYLDYQANESFLETAVQFDNVRRHVKQLGYKFYGRPAVYGVATFYVLVPANATGLGPKEDRIPILKKGSQFASSNGENFILLEDVDFNSGKREEVASKFDNSTANPTEYALRMFGKVKSGKRFYQDFTIGDFQKFLRLRIGGAGINEIESVFDSNGNEYYQVNYLTQDVIYKQTTNPRAAQDGVPSIIKPFVAARRFVMDQDETGTYIQFGYGSDNDLETTDVTDPSNIVLKQLGKNFITDDAFDPNQLLNTDKFGIAPSNTTIRVIFGSNTQQNISVAIGQLNQIVEANFEFPDASDTTDLEFLNVRSSLEVSNDEIISELTEIPSSEELRYRAYSIYASQNRSVTKNDYEAYCYLMPPSLGQVKRAKVVNDPSGTNRRMAMYIISANSDGELETANQSVKTNLKTWLQKNKMLNDGIDVYDAKIINVGFDYEVVTDPNMNSISVLADVDERLRNDFKDKLYIGEPISINSIYNTINKTIGVIDCVKVTPYVKNGLEYADVPLNIMDILSKDGTRIQPPKNCILEIKFLTRDIRGSVV